MVRNTKETALIVHRHGKMSEMPHALNEAEIGLAMDKNKIFMGNPTHIDLATRDEFPYQNIEILTEFSNVLDYIKYRYANNIQSVDGKFDRELYQEKLPIIILGTTEPSFNSETKMKLSNGEVISEEIIIPSGSTINNVFDAINNISNTTHIVARIYDNKLCLFGYGKEIIITGTNLNNLGLPTSDIADPTSPIIEDSKINLPYRPINEKLDDLLSIKDFSYKVMSNDEASYHNIDGDGKTDMGQGIFNAIKSVFEKSDDPQFKRILHFPAGNYVIKEVIAPLPIINGMTLVGEGVDKTILSTVSDTTITTLFNTEVASTNIIIKDMTFDCSKQATLNALLNASNVQNVLFENVKFVGNGDYAINIQGTSKNISLINCVFKGFKKCICSSSNLTNLTITNCIFDSYITLAIDLEVTLSTNYIKGCKIYGNTFTNGGSNYAIKIDGNGTVEYNTIINNTFDKEVVEQLNNKKPLNSNKFGAGKKNYTDILDPSTDTRKALLFNFMQPRWDYIQYLKSTGEDITFETDNEHIVVITDNGSEEYENRIKNVDNAVPTVKFVKDMANGGMNITELTYQDIQDGIIPLTVIDDKDARLSILQVDIINSFGKLYSRLNTAIEYTNGLTYYNGDIVKQNVESSVKYGVVINKHQAGSSIVNNNIVLVEQGLVDIKYADIVAIKDNNEYVLTRCGINNELTIDLQALDKHEYVRKTFTEGTAYNGIVEHLDKLYKVNMNSSQSTINNLHDTTLSKQLNINGYKYVFNFDRMINVNNELINTSELNLYGYKLVMKFYDNNGNLVNITSNKNLNPCGKMIVGISYNKAKSDN